MLISQTPQPTSAVARCLASQSPAAQDGITNATRSAATPIARKSHPATSVAPRPTGLTLTPQSPPARCAVGSKQCHTVRVLISDHARPRPMLDGRWTGMTRGIKMIDEQLTRLRVHGNNIHRYRRLLKGDLTDHERQFVERRLSEEQAAIQRLTANGFPLRAP